HAPAAFTSLRLEHHVQGILGQLQPNRLALGGRLEFRPRVAIDVKLRRRREAWVSHRQRDLGIGYGPGHLTRIDDLLAMVGLLAVVSLKRGLALDPAGGTHSNSRPAIFALKTRLF